MGWVGSCWSACMGSVYIYNKQQAKKKQKTNEQTHKDKPKKADSEDWTHDLLFTKQMHYHCAMQANKVTKFSWGKLLIGWQINHVRGFVMSKWNLFVFVLFLSVWAFSTLANQRWGVCVCVWMTNKVKHIKHATNKKNILAFSPHITPPITHPSLNTALMFVQISTFLEQS